MNEFEFVRLHGQARCEHTTAGRIPHDHYTAQRRLQHACRWCAVVAGHEVVEVSLAAAWQYAHQSLGADFGMMDP